MARPMNLSSNATFSALVSGVLAAGSLMTGAIAPVQAASSMFTEAAVNPESFLVMAAPRAGNAYNLVIVEQKPNPRACWQDNGDGTVDPLLLNFDFSGICSRATDSNGYSIRIGGEDLGLSYSLRLVNRGSYVSLVGTPSDRRQSELELGRTQTGGANFLAVKLNPGWELSRRIYGGKPLGHIYFSSSAGTIAQSPAPKLPPAPIAQKPVTPAPVTPAPIAQTPKPPVPGAVVGTPLPKPPVTQKPVEQKPIIIEVIPAPTPVAVNPPAVNPPAVNPPAASAPTVKPPAAQTSAYAHYAKLNSLYNEVLGRNVDPAGLQTYNAELVSGKSLESVRNVLVNSAEYKAMRQTTLAQMQQHPSYTALNAVYREVLGRDVDAAGLASYGPKLEQGKKIAWVRDRLVKSDEGRAVAIARTYQTVLGRSVDPSGMKTYLNRMQRNRWSIAKVQKDLANSSEAKLAKR
ncbi:MAG: DUF3747 domain-containing protein [Synechococcales cyanobacterium RU_4_20]|nr:DUF3747 domain-containing protein [Synechococcales cyanobacterium RU_4_20]NJR69708.1 DUF3747 domain-containing protein [Synechococcales cyanobacterium CRU_2_2]